MNISVIMTVKNEGDGLRPLLDSLINQTQFADEVVVCDGGSTDNTLEILEAYKQYLPLQVIISPGSNISQGRNRAIEACSGSIIAVTDAGVVLAPDWLEKLIQPIADGESAVVSGWFEPDPFTDFEVVMGATVLPAIEDVDPAKFLPSSRSVAFTRNAWEEVGGYPEWLDYCEDLVFDRALREKYGSFPFEGRAVVYFRPRGSLRSFFRQYFYYARGDGKANLWPLRHLVRYFTYLVMLPFVLRLIWREKWPGWVLLALGVGSYSLRPAERLWIGTWGWRPPARLRAFALIPIIRLVGDIAKMIGYPVGLFWRLRNLKNVRG